MIADYPQLPQDPITPASFNPPKPTAAEKRHLHKLSEQSRRDAIKAGYEALYLAIPALRTANLMGGAVRGGSGPGGGGAIGGRRRDREKMSGGGNVVKAKRGRKTKEEKKRMDMDNVMGNDGTNGGVGEEGMMGIIQMAGLGDGAGNELVGGESMDQATGISVPMELVDPSISMVHESSTPAEKRKAAKEMANLRNRDGEILDGRQGPRSETVVLQQSRFHFIAGAKVLPIGVSLLLTLGVCCM